MIFPPLCSTFCGVLLTKRTTKLPGKIQQGDMNEMFRNDLILGMCLHIQQLNSSEGVDLVVSSRALLKGPRGGRAARRGRVGRLCGREEGEEQSAWQAGRQPQSVTVTAQGGLRLRRGREQNNQKCFRLLRCFLLPLSSQSESNGGRAAAAAAAGASSCEAAASTN